MNPFLSPAEYESLERTRREAIQECTAYARRSRDPVLVELGRELESGRLSPSEALAGSAYRDVLAERMRRAGEYYFADDDQRREMEAAEAQIEEESKPAGGQPGPGERSTVDFDDFAEQNFLRR